METNSPRMMFLYALLLCLFPITALAAKCGLTIITHGYQSTGFGLGDEEPPVWVFSMAQAANERAGGNVPIYVVRYNASVNEAVLDWKVSYDAGANTYTLQNASGIDIEQEGSAIIILNWVLESNNFNNFYSAEYLDDPTKRPKLILTK